MLLTLAEAKAHLNIETGFTDDDSLIQAYVAAAAAHLDAEYNVVVDQQDRTWIFDRWQQLMIVPSTPIETQSLALAYVDRAGDDQTITDFRALPFGRYYWKLAPAVNKCWPHHAWAPGVITVTGQAGYTDPADSDDVPADIKNVGRLLIGHWYQNREAVGPSMSEPDYSVKALLRPYKLDRV